MVVARFRGLSFLVQWKDCALNPLRRKSPVRATSRHRFARNSACRLGAVFIASAMTRSGPAALLLGIGIIAFSILSWELVPGSNFSIDLGALLFSCSESVYSRKFRVLP